MDFRDFYLNLPPPKRRRFAELAGYGEKYIYTHLTAPPQRRKVPNREGMNRLIDACRRFRDGPSKIEVFEYFYTLPG